MVNKISIKGVEKLVVDMDHPIWLAKPGFGIGSCEWGSDNHCALSKLRVATDAYCKETNRPIDPLYLKIENDLNYCDIVKINDGFHNGGRYREPVQDPNNHWKAVRLLQERLIAHPLVYIKQDLNKPSEQPDFQWLKNLHKKENHNV